MSGTPPTFPFHPFREKIRRRVKREVALLFVFEEALDVLSPMEDSNDFDATLRCQVKEQIVAEVRNDPCSRFPCLCGSLFLACLHACPERFPELGGYLNRIAAL